MVEAEFYSKGEVKSCAAANYLHRGNNFYHYLQSRSDSR